MKICFRRSWHKASIDVFVYNEDGGTLNWAQPINVVFEKGESSYTSACRLPDTPTFEIRPDDWLVLKKSIGEELELLEGRPNKSQLDGKLEATEFHLEDMRKLVFKNV